MPRNKTKILSIDPGTKYMGFGIFENTELVDYGVKTIKQGSKNDILKNVKEILERWILTLNPDYLIIEKNEFSQISTNIRLMYVISYIKSATKKAGIELYEFSPRTIRKLICNDGNATKKRISEALIIYYTELLPYISSDKKWRQRYYQNMFDAVAVGMAFIKRHINGQQAIQDKLWSK